VCLVQIDKRGESMTYKEHYYNFWLPILKKQYFKYKLLNDREAIIDLEANIWKNWSFTEKEKRNILRKVRGKNDNTK